MFTGLVEEIGLLTAIEHGAYSAKLKIACYKVLQDTKIGDSIAVNGACLTVVNCDKNTFTAEAMAETLARTNLGTLHIGQKVNLERAMTLGGRLGGHLVSGHIDGTAMINKVILRDIATEYQFAADAALLRYMVKKGSVTIDGTSLTLTEVDESYFTVALIPHTKENTVLGLKGQGATVNIEVDLLAKYVEKFCQTQEKKKNLDYAFLAENGFL